MIVCQANGVQVVSHLIFYLTLFLPLRSIKRFFLTRKAPKMGLSNIYSNEISISSIFLFTLNIISLFASMVFTFLDEIKSKILTFELIL